MTENFNEKEIKVYLRRKQAFFANAWVILEDNETTVSEKIEWLQKKIDKCEQVLERIDRQIRLFAKHVVGTMDYKIWELPVDLSVIFVWKTYEELGWMDLPTDKEIEANNNELIYRKALINTFKIEWLNFQISLLEASNTGTGTNTPKTEEATTATTTECETVQIKDLSNTELALYCSLIGINSTGALKHFKETGRKNFRTLKTAMNKVATEKMRLSIPPMGHPKTILRNRRKRYLKFLPLLPPEFKEKAENEIEKLEKIIEDW